VPCEKNKLLIQIKIHPARRVKKHPTVPQEEHAMSLICWNLVGDFEDFLQHYPRGL